MGHVYVSCRSLRLPAAVWLVCVVGACGDDGGGVTSATDSATGGPTDSATSEDGESETTSVVNCGFEQIEANNAPPTPACGGNGALDEGEELDGVGFKKPVAMDPNLPVAQVGVWTDIITEQGDGPRHMPIHAIHRPTGKFLLFGADSHFGQEPSSFDNDKVVWYPPAPCSPLEEGVENCDLQFDYIPTTQIREDHAEVPFPTFNLFCAGHVNVLPAVAGELFRPLTLTIGGADEGNVNNGIDISVVFEENLAFDVDPNDPPPPGNTFDWSEIVTGEKPRWYPTVTVLPDKRIFVAGGSEQQVVECNDANDPQCQCSDEACQDCVEGTCTNPDFPCCFDDEDQPIVCAKVFGACTCDPGASDNDACRITFEKNSDIDIYDHTTQPGDWLLETQVTALEFLKVNELWYYLAFILPDFENSALGGKILVAGGEEMLPTDGKYPTRIFDYATDPTTIIDLDAVSCTPGSSAVMYGPGKVMKFSGGDVPTRVTEVIDFTEGDSADWRRVEPTSMGRHYSTAVLLPDGTVLATGGGARGYSGDNDVLNTPQDDKDYRVFTTDLFDPATEEWCRLADVAPPADDPDGLSVYRGYHSQSFLLRDGRVFLGAGGYTVGVSHFDYQYFFPPYLFKGPRPDIDEIPGGFVAFGNYTPPGYLTGGSFDMIRLNDVPVDRVTMIKLSSTTHNFDMENRFLELDFAEAEDDPMTLEVSMPPTTCYATPGPYMVFAISDLGVPSIGQYIYVDGSCPAADTPSEPPLEIFEFDLHNGIKTDGVVANCDAAGSLLGFDDFGRSVDQICAAAPGCPESGSVAITATLTASDSPDWPGVDTELDTAKVEFSGGEAEIVDPLVVMADGAGWSPGTDLGPGRHTIELCAEFMGLSGCREQVVYVEGLEFGPDQHGYRAAVIGEGFRPLARIPGTTVIEFDGDTATAIDLPRGFEFPFYGETYRTIYVGANGGIRVRPGSIHHANKQMPHKGKKAAHIAPFWDDLEAAGFGRVLYRHDGDHVIVSWEGVPHKQTTKSSAVSFQAHLFASGRIEFHYQDTALRKKQVHRGRSATIGIQSPDGGDGLQVSHNDDNVLTSQRAVGFDITTCVASRLEATNNSTCRSRLALGESVTGEICAARGPVAVPVPTVPTLCDISNEAFVVGDVLTDSGRKEIRNGEVELATGRYTLNWRVLAPGSYAQGTSYNDILPPRTQGLDVREVRSGSLCCDAAMPQITLTDTDDVFSMENDGPACVRALAGSDNVSGSPDADTVLGDQETDTLHGHLGGDTLIGCEDEDFLAGGEGDDRIFGDTGSDVLMGGPGADHLRGGPGGDELYGEDDADHLMPGSGVDFVDAGPGDDTIVFLHACELEEGKFLDGGAGTDTLVLPPGITLTDVLAAGVAVENVESTVELKPEGHGISDCDPELGWLTIQDG